MMQMPNIADPNTYKLLTPGPLTTTLAVREAMLVDRCTWDDDYKAMTESIRAWNWPKQTLPSTASC